MRALHAFIHGQPEQKWEFSAVFGAGIRYACRRRPFGSVNSTVIMNTLIQSHRCRFTGAVLIGTALLIAPTARSQNLFVADHQDNTIYEFTPGGVKSTFASGLHNPQELAFDSAGNLYEADSLSGTISKFTPGGVPSTFATGLYEPTVLAFDSAGNLYEGDFGSHIANTGFLHKFTPGGAPSTFATGVNPTGLAIDKAGDVFMSDIQAGSIFKFTSGGAESVFASGLNQPFALAFDSAGNLYEADSASGSVNKFTPGGVKSTFASGLGINNVDGLAFDSAGNLFVSQDGGGHIFEFTPGGVQSTFTTTLTYPGQLAFQPVPEPGFFGLLAVGAAAFLARRRLYFSVGASMD
jgi:sugar lactone lactonase YvrE